MPRSIRMKESIQLPSHHHAFYLMLCYHNGGPEAIAESYYSTMRAQQKSGGQSDENLGRRTKLSWCLPSLKSCDDIIGESVKIYLKSDENIQAHRQTTFFLEEQRSMKSQKSLTELMQKREDVRF